MIWRGGRVAEGAPLLREYTRNRIVGSNPTFTARPVSTERDRCRLFGVIESGAVNR